MELLQLNNSISPKSEWALGTSMSMCERLTVPLLTTIMFQNASSWRLVFSIKSLASAKAEISGDIFEWLDTADHTTGYTFGRLRCCCWKNSGKNVSRRSYYWWICPLPPYILCFWHGPEVLSKVCITTKGPCLMLMMVPENNRVKWKSHCVRTTHTYRPNWSEVLRQVMLFLLSLNQNHAVIAKSVLGEDPL